MTETQADGCEASASKKLKTTSDETDSSTKKQYNILILGASYGSLLATKILLAGHNATLICREETAALFNSEGSIIRTPIKGRPAEDLLEICSRNLAGGTLRASAPDGVDPINYDHVVLAMQEPQYSASGVRELVGRIAMAHVPTMAITNMPLLPYLKRIPGFRVDDNIRSCFTEAALWDGFDAGLVTQCSPDPQAFRPPDEKPNVLQVRLPTNFKAARFASDQHTRILQVLEHGIEAALYSSNDGQLIQVPVKLRVHDSVFVPLAKWAMLLAGNYRCVQPYPEEMHSIKDAVCANVNASRAVYDWVVDVCVRLGGDASDFVPFEKYAKAAASLGSPSSAARALKQGAKNIERVDKLVALIAAQQGNQLDDIDATVAMVDNWLTQNRIQAQSK
jgi:hypothetical protein